MRVWLYSWKCCLAESARQLRAENSRELLATAQLVLSIGGSRLNSGQQYLTPPSLIRTGALVWWCRIASSVAWPLRSKWQWFSGLCQANCVFSVNEIFHLCNNLAVFVPFLHHPIAACSSTHQNKAVLLVFRSQPMIMQIALGQKCPTSWEKSEVCYE